MKMQNVKNIDTAKIYFRTKWFIFTRSNARFFVYGFVTGIIGSLLVANFSSIHATLIEIDTNGRIQYFTSISGAILGVLAITFSLSVFALQHAAENGSARVLETFGNSRRVVFDYVLIATIALLIYIFGLTPKATGYFTSISFLLSLLLIVLVLWRVFAFYKSIVKFINPLEQVRQLSNAAKKLLSNARNLLLLIRKNEDTPTPPQSGPASAIDPEDLFVAANFDHQDIYNTYRSNVTALVDRMKIYAEKGRHEVTLEGYRELSDIVNLYFSVRKYSTATVGLFVEDGRTDQYLMLVLEQLKNLYSQAIRLEDQDGLQQNFLCHVNIAIGATQYKFIDTDVANANLNFVIGYLHSNLLDATRKNVDDAVMNGIRYLSAVITHIPTEHYLSMSQLADEFKEQALTTIAVRKWYITQEAVNGLVMIVVWSLQENFAAEQMLKTTLKNLSDVALHYVTNGMNVSISGGALSSAIASVNQKSIPYIVNEYLVQYWEKHGDFDQGVFEDFIEYYESLGKTAAESGSFLMHFVLSALNLHLEQLVRLRSNEDQKNPESFLTGIKQVLAAYRRIYSYLPKDYERKSFGYLEFEKLKEAALWALKEKDLELLTELVDTFKSLYRQSREKTTDEFTALRIYVDIVELGAIASVSDMNEVADQIVEMAGEVQREQLRLHASGEIPESYRKQLVERLSHEIWRIYDDYRQYHPMQHDEIKLANMITSKALITYFNRIELIVYKREITKRHRGGMF